MTTITIEVPDSLAERLIPYQERLSEILAIGLGELSPLPSEVYQHILSFLAKNPTSEQLAAFRPTQAMQDRLRTLLDREKSGLLTEMEQQELNEYEKIEHVMVMFKGHYPPP
jgi:hypothetical protein